MLRIPENFKITFALFVIHLFQEIQLLAPFFFPVLQRKITGSSVTRSAKQGPFPMLHQATILSLTSSLPESVVSKEKFPRYDPVILLQIVMVSPRGTHLVKNHESQLKKTSPKLKMIGPLCHQTVNQKTDSKTLYYSMLKYS